MKTDFTPKWSKLLSIHGLVCLPIQKLFLKSFSEFIIDNIICYTICLFNKNEQYTENNLFCLLQSYVCCKSIQIKLWNSMPTFQHERFLMWLSKCGCFFLMKNRPTVRTVFEFCRVSKDSCTSWKTEWKTGAWHCDQPRCSLWDNHWSDFSKFTSTLL